MGIEKTPLFKVSYGISTIVFVVIGIVVILGIGIVTGITSLQYLKHLVLNSVYLYTVLTLIIICSQIYVSSWMLYDDKLIVKIPFRPFYNYFEFPIKDIKKLEFNDIALRRVIPSIVIDCANKRYKKI